MKIAVKVFSSIFAVVIILLSLVMTVIEGRLLFSGEWQLHASVVLGFVRYFLRLLFAIGGIAVGVCEFIPKARGVRLFISLLLLVFTAVSFFNITNGIEWLFLIPSLLYFLSCLVRERLDKCK